MDCIIEIKDEVNVKIHNLNLVTRRKLEKKFKYFMPYAYHVPAYKLGRWDGCVSYFSPGAVTYLNLLEEIIPVLIDEGYQINSGYLIGTFFIKDFFNTNYFKYIMKINIIR